VARFENWRFDFTQRLAVAAGVPIQYPGGAGIWE
jgi:hypothetical protein